MSQHLLFTFHHYIFTGLRDSQTLTSSMKFVSTLFRTVSHHVEHLRHGCYVLGLCPPVLVLQPSWIVPGSSFSSLKRLFGSQVQCKTTHDIADYLKSGKCSKIVVMAGAGISTPSGIPDFRSPGTGLYDNLQKYNLPYPEAVFDIDYFAHDPQPFFTLAKELYPSGTYRPNIVHYFVKLLHDKGLLFRMYTQNIDGLERLAGIPEDLLVEAHGTFATATCQTCYKSYKALDIKDSILRGEVPRCKRNLCQGVVKPDIVFFGEQLPSRFWRFLVDVPQADLLIVMGTSLEVQPFAGIAEVALPGTPRLLFNKQASGPFLNSPRGNDVVAEGDIVDTVVAFCDQVGWKEELFDLMESSEAKHKKDQ